MTQLGAIYAGSVSKTLRPRLLALNSVPQKTCVTPVSREPSPLSLNGAADVTPTLACSPSRCGLSVQSQSLELFAKLLVGVCCIMLTTARLRLRPWRDEDLSAFAALNADPRVMQFLSEPMTTAQSIARAAHIAGQIDEDGFGLWAVEVPGVANFIGFVGLNRTAFNADFTPCIEIGWRLAYEYWGFGYATEAASVAIADGFDRLALEEIVSYTTVANARSRRVMERLGMTHLPAEDFDHPKIPEGHPLRRHVLYRLRRHNWKPLHKRPGDSIG